MEAYAEGKRQLIKSLVNSGFQANLIEELLKVQRSASNIDKDIRQRTFIITPLGVP